jgi:hypothetical protein
MHGRGSGNETLYIPYLGVSVLVLILSVVFAFSYVPDIRSDESRCRLIDSPAKKSPVSLDA